MTDRELLELAAKAYGIDFRYICDGDGGQCLWDGAKLALWNPLTDDGDALRLAVKLHLWKPIRIAHRFVRDDHDLYASTRRAIVRAAAAIAQEQSHD